VTITNDGALLHGKRVERIQRGLVSEVWVGEV